MTQPQPKFRAEDPAAVLLDETVLTVGSDGRATEHHRHVVKILRPAGRDEGVVAVPFDNDRKLLSLHIWSVGPDGHEYAMKDSEIAEFGLPGEGGQLYVDERYKVANPPGRDPGGIVAYEYEVRSRPYVNEETWFFQSELPGVKQSFTLQLPAGYTYRAVWAHHDKTEAVDLERQRWRWEMNDMPAIDLEDVPLHPSTVAIAGRMTVHYGPSGTDQLGTWQGVGQWYNDLSRARLAASPEIAAKAAELTQGKTDFFDKAEAIGEFAQKGIRYFVIERGIGGDQPHPAADIFRNRYGDCKDKATLLASMLSTVGIHATWVLVDTRRGAVDPSAPSTYGNHAIAAIEIPAGYNSPKLRSVVTAKSGKRYLIFDPTWEKTAFGQLEWNLQGGYGILVEAGASEVIALPVLKPESNTLYRTASFQLQPDGELKGSVVVKSFGDLSESSRDMYSRQTLKEQTDNRNRTLGHDLSTFTVSDVKVENVEALNKELTTSYTLDAEHFARSMGALLMVRPRVLGTDGIYVDRKPRSMPIDLKEAKLEKDEFSIELPPGYAVDELPDPVKLDLGFAAYESSTTLSGNKLHYTRTYTVREVTLPADRYADVQKLAATIDADEKNSAVFKKQ
ncbi:DUF3857 domain-containing transglutaminase family protein [Granulicella rosea]|nr:DUF3857 and transglutaminase domain-containing protein [Granulicella rosea]